MSTRTDSGLIRQAVCPYLHRWLVIKSRSQDKLGLGLPTHRTFPLRMMEKLMLVRVSLLCLLGDECYKGSCLNGGQGSIGDKCQSNSGREKKKSTYKASAVKPAVALGSSSAMSILEPTSCLTGSI